MAEETQPTTTEKASEVKELQILLDSSWLIALINESDSHHRAVDSSFGALLPYQPTFYIPAVVYMETMSYLVRVKRLSPGAAYEKIMRFLKKVHYKHSQQLNITQINQKFGTFSRMKGIKALRPMDFYIATEGMLLNAKILTCDLGMYRNVKKHYKKVYFLTDKLSGEQNDLARLINEIQLGK